MREGPTVLLSSWEKVVSPEKQHWSELHYIPLLRAKLELVSEHYCTRKNTTRRHQSLREKDLIISGTQENACFHVHNFEVQEFTTIKQNTFACFSAEPLWESWLRLHLSDQKDKKLPMWRKGQTKKRPVLLHAHNFKMVSLAFQQSKYIIYHENITSAKAVTVSL